MTAKKRPAKTVVGWTEFVSLPEWRVNAVHAKIDTGARSSSLHVEDLERLPGNKVQFWVVRRTKPRKLRRKVVTKVVKWGRVRSSNGHLQRRPFVRTRIRIGEVEKDVEVNLVDRENMRFMMLIGRTTLRRDFVVDVSKRDYQGRPPVTRGKS